MGGKGEPSRAEPKSTADHDLSGKRPPLRARGHNSDMMPLMQSTSRALQLALTRG